MNAISKRLLSWLMVAVLVLSLVPALDLAVETKAADMPAAAQEKITAGNNLDDSDAKIAEYVANGTCPMCGKSGITWKTQTNGSNIKPTADGAHYVFAKNNNNYPVWSMSGYLVYGSGLGDNLSICVAAYSNSTVEIGTRLIQANGSKNTINIMGQGTFIAKNTNPTKIEGGASGRNTLNIYGGTFKRDASISTTNPLFYIKGVWDVNMYDGAVIGAADKEGANLHTNVQVDHSSANFNMYGGTIQNGDSTSSTFGGNVTVTKGSFNMYAGTVTGGSTTASGGNIYNAATMTMYGGTIENGEADSCGGNIHTATDLTLGGGLIAGGTADAAGGNINVGTNKLLTVDGAVIANGLVNATEDSNWGGNIRAWQAKVTVNDGWIYGGHRVSGSHRADNIGCQGAGSVLTINGGTIFGDVQTNADTTVTLSGAPTIVKSCELPEGFRAAYKSGYSGLNISATDADISTLSSAASILISAPAALGEVFTVGHDNAANVARCFTFDGQTEWEATVNESKQLVISEKTAPKVTVAQIRGKSFITKDYAEDELANLIADYKAAKAEGKAVYIDMEQAFRQGKTLTLVLTGGDYYINSYAATVNLSGEGTLYAIDTNNADFYGNGQFIIAEDANITVNADAVDPITGMRYVSVRPDENRYTWHAYYIDVEMTNATLRTTEAGLYYKAEYKFADRLREIEAVKGYGVVLSLNGMPDENFEAAGLKYTYKALGDDWEYINGSTINNGLKVSGTSGSVFGILKEIGTDGRTAEQNFNAMSKDIYANAYMAIDRDPCGEETIYYVMGNADNTSSKTEVKINLLQAVTAINTNWATLNATAEAKASMVEFVNNWADATKLTDAGLAAWEAATSNIQ